MDMLKNRRPPKRALGLPLLAPYSEIGGRRPSGASFGTAFYISIIQHQKGDISPREVERLFSKEREIRKDEFYADYNGRIYKNLKGSILKDQKFIDRVEQALPGTEEALRHPLWRIIDHRSLSLDVINGYMRMLSPDAIKYLFSRQTDGTLKRKNISSNKQIVHIEMLNNLDALAVLLLLIKEAEIKGQDSLCIQFKWAAYKLLSRLSCSTPCRTIGGGLERLLFHRFINKSIRNIEREGQAPVYDFNYESRIDRLLSLSRLAHHHGLISDEKSRMQFLYWVQNFSEDETAQNLIERFKAIQKSKEAVKRNAPIAIFDTPKKGFNIASNWQSGQHKWQSPPEHSCRYLRKELANLSEYANACTGAKCQSVPGALPDCSEIDCQLYWCDCHLILYD